MGVKPVIVLLVRVPGVAVVVKRPAVKAAFVALCMENPVMPVVEVFTQVSGIEVLVGAPAVKLDGGAIVMTVTTLLQGEFPPVLEARTR